MSPFSPFCIRAIILGWLCASLILALAGQDALAASASPTCGPATLNDSALLAGAVTVSPLPGSRDATPQTQISFAGVPASELSVQSVVGTATGRHSGRLEAYSQGDGASFVPSQPFAEGERVTVRARLRAGGRRSALLDTFVVARLDHISTTPATVHPGRSSEEQGFHSRPDLHPPVVAVTTASPGVAPGDLFMAPYAGAGQPGPMILDPSGSVVWFKPLPAHVAATNFQVQEYEGRPVLTWWEGNVTLHGFGLGNDVIEDQTYTKIASVKAGNGLYADLHDFQLTPRGTALITAYEPVMCNLAGVHGPAEGAVTDGVVQEIDVRTGLVRMQWTSLDHVGLAESYEPVRTFDVLAYPYDYFHVNSLDALPEGGLIVSSRNTWAFYDLEPRSERIAWRVGGKHSSFGEGPGARTAFQHDPRVLPNGTISVFDNGASPKIHSQSRGVVLSVDGPTHSVALVQQLVRVPPLLAESQGNMQALSNGDWLLGWGQLADLSEFSAQGALLFDAHLPANVESYRDFRFVWEGHPVHGPSFAYATGAGSGTVYASWNGATQVAAWRVLAGPSPATLTAVAQVPKSGFETSIPLPGGVAGPDAQVQALDAAGNVLGASAVLNESGL
jgi:hypothetical protein